MRDPPNDDRAVGLARPREHDGTDLPSVIARLGQRLAWRSQDATLAAAPGHPATPRDAPQVGGPATAGTLAPRRPPR
jgi:hypothetical protein